MEPILHIRFPDLSNPDSRAIVKTTSKTTSIRVKNKVLVHYHYTMISLRTSAVARASVEIKTAGLYFFAIAGTGFTMERHGADNLCISPSTGYCQGIYLQKGVYSICFEQGKHRFSCIASPADWLCRIKQSLPIMTGTSERMEAHQQALIFPYLRLPDIFANYLLSMAYESDDGIKAAQLNHFHKFNRILAHYDGLLAQKRQENTTRKNYTEIVDAFVLKCKQPLLIDRLHRLEEVAASIPVSPKTLNRAFHSVFHGKLTPSRLFRHMRMVAAYEMLSKNKGAAVQQTAQLLGYSDSSAFSKAYRNILGHRPSQAHLFQTEVIPLSLRNMSETNHA